MPRQARIVVPDQPHHVTQRGNQRAPIFFEPGDQAVYLDLLARETRRRDVAVWAYCLMPNHVHLIMTPRTGDALGLAVGEAHRRYSNFVNARAGWTRHLFQSRFASVAMDEAYLMAAARYVSLNPVRARLTARPEDWEWSSVRAHLSGKDDALVTVRPLLDRAPDFALLLSETHGDDPQRFEALRRAELTGRPAGDASFVAAVERALGRVVTARGRGRPAKAADAPSMELLG